MKTPQWIDKKTGHYKKNYDTLVPGTNKPFYSLTKEEFALAVSSWETKEKLNSLYNYFCEIGWPEGYSYCVGHYSYACFAYYGLMLHNAPKA